MPLPSSTLTRAFGGPFLYEYDVDASFIAPDRFHFTISTSDVSGVDIIAIGQQVWQKIEGMWQLQAQPADIPYQPIPLCEAILPELNLAQAEPQPEEIDGVKTVHYAFLKNPSPQGVGKVFGVGSDMALLVKKLDVGLWLSEDGNQLVRLEFSGRGLYSDGRLLMVHVVLDVRDVNGGDISIEPPA
jgi:hypothetical protein